jgi:hypothetical protein
MDTIIGMPFTGRYITNNIPSLRDGLNDAMESSEIRDTEMADCENFTVDDVAMITAPGYVAGDDNPQPGPYYAIYHFRKDDGTSVLIRQRQNKLEYSEDQSTFFTTGWTECTSPTEGSPAATVELQEITPTFATLNNTVIFTNGKNTVMSSTDGKTWSLEPSVPKAYYVISNGLNRLVYARTDDDPSIIHWSDINQPTTIGADSWQFINPNDGQKIWGMGMAPNGALILFKTLSFYSIDDVTLDTVGVNFIGNFKLASHHTIQTTEDSIICGGLDGIYEWKGGAMRLISGRLKQGGRNLTLNSQSFRAGYYKLEYHLSVPDTDSGTTNVQEYVVYKARYRNDPLQPYVITRNKRNIGCYCHVDDFSVLGRPGGLYIGDSTGATGSPASGGTLFGWINSYRQKTYPQGLAGDPQPAYFTTKYFTENAAFYMKRAIKAFIHLKVEDNTSVEFSYRFQPYGAWSSLDETVEVGGIDWEFSDGSTGEFEEGYGFYELASATAFFDLEKGQEPRGIQFKVASNQVNDVQILSMAYKTLIKPIMR